MPQLRTCLSSASACCCSASFQIRPSTRAAASSAVGSTSCDDAGAGVGQHDEREARVVRVRLAADEAAALHRGELARDAGGRDAEPLGEVEPAQAPVGRAVQLEQERDVVEAEAVVPGEGHVDVAHDDGARVGELESGREGCGCGRGSHARQHTID